ncbi:MAG: Coenzyme F420 hydrogenase/dehydrogenase, beta subunit C-terminal domain [Desulfobacterales bacterium]|nr:Coenzyme F420 hydrogenase/dehydrogenase, beta subunit C-terminal domain [Desulfobacterales bacterium]
MNKILFIGYPCQVTAIKRLQVFLAYIEKNYPGRAVTWPQQYPALRDLQWVKDIELLIGQFCRAGTCHSGLSGIFQRHGIDIRAVRRLDIGTDEIRVDLDGVEKVIPVQKGDLRQKGMPGCAICSDYTALSADISLDGGKPSPAGTQLISRTDSGRKIIARALSDGVVEKIAGVDRGERIIEMEQVKARRSAAKAETFRDRLPPAFYTEDSFDVESSIYDSLLQDFYMVKDLIKNDLCVLCGMCETVCPLGSITLDGERPRFNNRCSDKICGMCFSTCPQSFVLQGVDQQRLFREMEAVAPLRAEDMVTVRSAAVESDSKGEGRDTLLASLAGYCLDQGLVSRVMVLHHWNSRTILKQLGDISATLLVDYVREKRGGRADENS